MTRSFVPTTSPAASMPAGFSVPGLIRPWPRISSPRFRLAARTRTSSWAGPGSGGDFSRSSRAMPAGSARST